MRSIFVGIEYAGKSTLIELLDRYYRHRSIRTHGDDHFTIPDATLSPASRKTMVGLPDDMKERMQRMQIHYHIDIIKKYECPLIAGWHIEEAVYSDMYGDDPSSPYYKRYVYNFQRLYETQVLEGNIPDLVMFHVTASDEVIARRMSESPHEYPIVRQQDIPEVKRRFDEEVSKSLFTHGGRTVVIDTTEKTPEESFDEVLLKSDPLVTFGEIAVRAMEVPDQDYEVRYENGIRRMEPSIK